MVAAIRREDELLMPPRALDGAERDLLEAWIAAGAEWPADLAEDPAVAVCAAARDAPPVKHNLAGPGEPLSFDRDAAARATLNRRP